MGGPSLNLNLGLHFLGHVPATVTVSTDSKWSSGTAVDFDQGAREMVRGHCRWPVAEMDWPPVCV